MSAKKLMTFENANSEKVRMLESYVKSISEKIDIIAKAVITQIEKTDVQKTMLENMYQEILIIKSKMSDLENKFIKQTEIFKEKTESFISSYDNIIGNLQDLKIRLGDIELNVLKKLSTR